MGNYFSASDNVNGYELWRTDGTEAGTIMVANINAAGDSYPSFLKVAGKRLFFSADDSFHGAELWKYEDPTDPPCTNELVLAGLATQNLYEATIKITSTATIPLKPDFTNYYSNSILLNPGFDTVTGAKFLADVKGCN